MRLRIGCRAKRRTMADRTPEVRGRMDAGCVPRIGVEVETEAPARGGCQAGRKPELKLWRTEATDQQVCAFARRYADDAIAPSLDDKTKIADRPCPGNGTNDRHNRRIKLWTPGDDGRVDRWRVGIGRERSGPNGTTSLPAGASRSGQDAVLIDEQWPRWLRWRAGPARWPSARCRGTPDCAEAIPRQSRARPMRSESDRRPVSGDDYILASQNSSMPPAVHS